MYIYIFFRGSDFFFPALLNSAIPVATNQRIWRRRTTIPWNPTNSAKKFPRDIGWDLQFRMRTSSAVGTIIDFRFLACLSRNYPLSFSPLFFFLLSWLWKHTTFLRYIICIHPCLYIITMGGTISKYYNPPYIYPWCYYYIFPFLHLSSIM